MSMSGTLKLKRRVRAIESRLGDAVEVHRMALAGGETIGSPDLSIPVHVYVLTQGSGGQTVTWNAVFDTPGGVAPVLSATAGAVDVFVFVPGASGKLALIAAGYNQS